MQTKTLRFEAGDGRRFRVRSVDKDPTPTLPPDLRDTFAEWVVQDQISTAHPAGPIIVDGLADAAGIRHVDHRFVVIPDDPRLGEFRKDFGGMLGIIEEEIRIEPPVTRGFEDVLKTVEAEEMNKLADAGPGDRVDARALLKARLFDHVHRGLGPPHRAVGLGPGQGVRQVAAHPLRSRPGVLEVRRPRPRAGARQPAPLRELREGVPLRRRDRLERSPGGSPLPRRAGPARLPRGRVRAAEVVDRRRDREGGPQDARAVLPAERDPDRGAAEGPARSPPAPGRQVLRDAGRRGRGPRHRPGRLRRDRARGGHRRRPRERARRRPPPTSTGRSARTTPRRSGSS